MRRLPRHERTLRVAALVYAAAAVAAWAIPTPVGGNTVRLGALVGGPLLLMARGRRLGSPVVVLLVAFAGWQWSAARARHRADRGRPLHGGVLLPAAERLPGPRGGPPFRVEIPFTFSHWETAEVAPRFPLARGWLRPDDREYNHLFYGGTLERGDLPRVARRPRRALRRGAARANRLQRPRRSSPDRGGLPTCGRAWSSRDWPVYEVTAAASTVAAGAAWPRCGAPALARARGGRSCGALVAVLAGAPARVSRRPASGPAWSRLGRLQISLRHELTRPGRVLDHGRRCA